MPMFTKTSLLALVLSAPLAATPVLAEQHSSDGEAMQSSDDTTQSTDSEMPTAESQDDTSVAAGTDGTEQADPLLVTVGDVEITASDVEAALMAFPAQIRQSQPSEALIPMAMEQLILRELILQAAMDDNMADDADVQAIVEENAARSQDDAMVQVYVQRELEGAVTDEAVQQTYDQIASTSDAEVPPLDAVRPQIEQQLQQQRMNELGASLQEGVEIVYYGPDGQPLEASTADGSDMESSSGDVSDNAPMDSEVENAPETDGQYGDDNSDSDSDTQN